LKTGEIGKRKMRGGAIILPQVISITTAIEERSQKGILCFDLLRDSSKVKEGEIKGKVVNSRGNIISFY